MTDTDSKMLAMLYDRRDTVTNLHICEAKAEYGDRRAQCSGDCISEQEWGEMRIPVHKKQVAANRGKLRKVGGKSCKSLSAFVWFKTKKDQGPRLNADAEIWLGRMVGVSDIHERFYHAGARE